VPKQLDSSNIPKHIAIIMDGNGRWARAKGHDRLYGHSSGVDSVRETIKAAVEFGVKHLTLYAFSAENWGRPQEEIDGLMELLVASIHRELPVLNGHAAIISALKAGTVIIDVAQVTPEITEKLTKTTEPNKFSFEIKGGVAEMLGDKIVLLAE